MQYEEGLAGEAAALLPLIHALRLELLALVVDRCHVHWQGFSALGILCGPWLVLFPSIACGGVWCLVLVVEGSSLYFLMHSVNGAPYGWACSPSSELPFEFYGCPPIVGLRLPSHYWFVGVFLDLWWALMIF